MGNYHEKRTEIRRPSCAVIKYSHPSLNSRLHLRLNAFAKKLRRRMPKSDVLMSRLITSNFTSNFISPRKTCALAMDVSTAGMSILTTERLREGQDILIFREQVPQKAVAAKVRWCAKDSGSFYKVGLHFNGGEAPSTG